MTDEERKARIYHHMYETCEGIAEHAERIVALEELVQHMYVCICHHEWGGNVCCENCPLDNNTGDCDYNRRMDELEVPR